MILWYDVYMNILRKIEIKNSFFFKLWIQNVCLNDYFIKIVLFSVKSVLYYSLIRLKIMDVHRVSPLTGRVYRYPKWKKSFKQR